MKFLHCKSTVAIILCLTMLLAVVGCGSVNFAVNFIVDGEIYDSIRTNGSEMISLPKNPTKEGHRFVGWYWDEGEWKEPFTATSLLDAPLASSMNIYAYFKPISNTNDPSDNNDPGDNNNNNNNPTATVYNTPSEILDAAEKLADNTYLSNGHVYTLSGKIVSIVTAWSDQYSNISVLIAVDGTDGRTIECFRLSGEGAKELKVGDQITVKGAIKLYAAINDAGEVTSRKVEFERPELLSVTSGGTVDPTPGYQVPTEITVVDPLENTPYHFAMVQKNLGKTVYLTGVMDGYYLATTENIAEAANVYIEPVPGFTIEEECYIFFVVEGERIYLNVYKNGNYNNFDLSATPTSAFRYNDTVKTVWSSIDDVMVALGTDSAKEYSNVTIRYTDVSSFYVHFIASEKPNEPIPGGSTENPEPTIPETPDEILDAAEALGDNEYLADQHLFVLSGEIIDIISPWSEEFENIRVLIAVDGTNGRTIECFRLSGEGTATLKIGDKITVEGPIMRYAAIDDAGNVTSRKIEFYYPTLLEITSSGDPNPDPGPTIYQTPAEIMEAAKLLSPGAYLSEGHPYTLSGTVTSVDIEYDAVYNNISVTILVDGTTDSIQAFRLTGDTALLQSISIGDQITVKGPILMYQNNSTGVLKLEFERPLLTAYTAGTGGGVDTPEINAVRPEIGTPYLFTLRQTNAGVITYFSGVMDQYYLGTTEDIDLAVNVYIEETTGGYYLYFIKDGVKRYINLAEVMNGEKLYINPALEETPTTVYIYDEALGTLVGSAVEKQWIYGTSASGTYTNAAVRELSGDNIPLRFVASDKVDVIPDPDQPREVTIAEFIEIALSQPNRGDATTEKYIIKGVITDLENLIYGNMTVTDETGSIYVYGVYDSTGEFRYEDMSVKPRRGDTVTLLGVAGNYDRAQMQNGWILEILPCDDFVDDNVIYTTPEEIVNAAYALASNLYLSKGLDYTLTGEIISIDTAYNATYGNISVVIAIEGLENMPILCYRLSGAGVENLAVGDTITVKGPIKNYVQTDSATGAVTKQIIEFDKPTLEEWIPGEGSVSEEPEEIDIPGFLAIAGALASETTTTEKYIVTGKIIEITSPDKYGNITIQDDKGNTLFIYGTYDATGTVQFGSMTDQPVVGDTITVLGVAKNYKGTLEMEKGWILSVEVAAEA